MGIPKGRGHLRASGCGRPLWFLFWLLFVEQQKVTARRTGERGLYDGASVQVQKD